MPYKVRPIKSYLVNLVDAAVGQPDVLVRAVSLREAVGKVAQQFGVAPERLFGVPR